MTSLKGQTIGHFKLEVIFFTCAKTISSGNESCIRLYVTLIVLDPATLTTWVVREVIAFWVTETNHKTLICWKNSTQSIRLGSILATIWRQYRKARSFWKLFYFAKRKTIQNSCQKIKSTPDRFRNSRQMTQSSPNLKFFVTKFIEK